MPVAQHHFHKTINCKRELIKEKTSYCFTSHKEIAILLSYIKGITLLYEYFYHFTLYKNQVQSGL